MSKIHINKDFLINKYNSGIQIAKPNQSLHSSSSLSVAKILDMPFNVYFLDPESRIISTNELTTINCGFTSINDAIGRTIRDVSDRETAEKLIQRDQFIIKTKKMHTFDDYHISLNNDDTDHEAVTFKFPWYMDNNTIGVFGCSIVIGKQSIAKSLEIIMQLGLLNKKINGEILNCFGQ